MIHMRPVSEYSIGSRVRVASLISMGGTSRYPTNKPLPGARDEVVGHDQQTALECRCEDMNVHLDYSSIMRCGCYRLDDTDPVPFLIYGRLLPLSAFSV